MTTGISCARAPVLVLLLAGCGAVPADPPPVSPPIDMTCLVFFGWDSAALDERARRITGECAAVFRADGRSRVELLATTDSAGAPAYNRRLSAARGRAVAAELVRLGIDPGAIEIIAAGETHPLVPTQDGVRETQNRRVEMLRR